MANTTTVGQNTIQITGLDADWIYSTVMGIAGAQCFITAIEFIPSATDDRMIIHDGGIDDAAIFDSGPCVDEYSIKYVTFNPPKPCDPVIDISDCTLGTPANAKVVIHTL